ncbi:unnamed protein product [Symbiodinium sp. CCMP2592]|nr:unnamed protein product [Symbiodinium sp. CCMP2592]
MTRKIRSCQFEYWHRHQNIATVTGVHEPDELAPGPPFDKAKRGGQAREDVEDPQWRDHLWRGAYSPSQRPWRAYADKGKHEKEQPAPLKFPTYQSMTVREPANGPGKGAGKPSSTPIEEGSVMGLQPVLNMARKAELRVQRLIAHRDRARRQWEAYDAELKQTFIREKKKFSANMDRLSKDITEALQAQDVARRAVCQTVNGQPVAQAETAAEEDMEWERTRSTWEQDEGTDLHGVLQRAMTHADAAEGLMRSQLPCGAPPGFGIPDAATPGPGVAPAPAPVQALPANPLLAPPGIQAQILRMADEMRAASVAPGLDPYLGAVLHDRYQGSPSSAYLKAQGPSTSPSARVQPYETGAPVSDRREPDGLSLAARVEQKRGVGGGVAMRPFGLPPTAPPPAPGFVSINGVAQQIPIASDDELDTANAAQDAGEPPPQPSGHGPMDGDSSFKSLSAMVALPCEVLDHRMLGLHSLASVPRFPLPVLAEENVCNLANRDLPSWPLSQQTEGSDLGLHLSACWVGVLCTLLAFLAATCAVSGAVELGANMWGRSLQFLTTPDPGTSQGFVVEAVFPRYRAFASALAYCVWVHQGFGFDDFVSRAHGAVIGVGFCLLLLLGWFMLPPSRARHCATVSAVRSMRPPSFASVLIPLGICSSPRWQLSVGLGLVSCRRPATRTTNARARKLASPCFWRLLLSLFSVALLPEPVSAMPPGLFPDEPGEEWSDQPAGWPWMRGDSRPDPLPPAVRPLVLPVAADTVEVRIGAYVVSPFFAPECLELDAQLPCEQRDIERQVSRRLDFLRLPFSDSLIAASVQPWRSCLVFLVYPEWTTYAGLTAVVLDLSRMQPGCQGPITACFLTRPTTRSEMLREAGLYSMPAGCRFFVGDSLEPITDDEPVWLHNGDVLKLVRHDDGPDAMPGIQWRLQRREAWPLPPAFPTVRQPRAVMLLHHTGRSLFSRHDPALGSVDVAAATFVGVDRNSVTFHAPPDGFLEHLSYRGSNVRSVLALVEKNPDGSQETVVLLDLRQVAGSPQFARLSTSRLTYDELRRLSPIEAPAGWRLVVQGGRKREQYISVRSGEVLVFGFLPREAFDPDFDAFSSSSEHDSSSEGSDRDGEEGDEAHEEEPPTDDVSTRSRSRNRSDKHPSPSTDHSFQGSFPAAALAVFEERLSGLAVSVSFRCNIKPLVASIAAICRPDALVGLFGRATGVRDDSSTTAQALMPSLGSTVSPKTVFSTVLACKGPTAHRVPDPTPAGSQYVPTAVDRYLAGHPLRDRGDREPIRPVPPTWFRPRPEPVPAQLPPAFIHGIFVVMTPDYKPDCQVLALRTPCALEFAIREVQSVRAQDDRRRFPRVFPAIPQPSREYAVLIAMPAWLDGLATVVFDCRQWSGKLFVGQVPSELTREDLLAAAGCGVGAWLFVATSTVDGVLYLGQTVRLFDGAVVRISPFPSDPVRGLLLEQMLRSADMWNANAQLPFSYAPAIWLLSDGVHIRLDVASAHVPIRSSEVAAALECDPSLIALKPIQPPVADHDARGWGSSAVVIATTQIPRYRDPGDLPVAVAFDQRPILQGLAWRLELSRMLSVQELTARYAHLCPSDLCVAFSGVDPVALPEGAAFDLCDGLCITVDFVFIDHPADTESSSALTSITTDGHESSGDDTHSSGSSCTSSRSRHTSPGAEVGPAADNAALHGGGRTRAPLPAGNDATVSRAKPDPYGRDDRAPFDHELPGPLTPVCCSEPCHGAPCPDPLVRAGVEDQPLCAASPPPPCLRAKLLVGPATTEGSRTDALSLLRDLARDIGLAWRYADAASIEERLLLAPPMLADEDAAFPVMLPLSFAILTPGYTQENVSVSVHIPAEEDHVLQLLQAERDSHRQRCFPVLVPALPQPSDRWGLVLALPLWDPQASVVILDARSYDGRLFAAQCAPFVSRRSILWLAGIPESSRVNVWNFFEDNPLPDFHECRIFPGQCLTICDWAAPRPETFFLKSLLRQALSWAPTTAFPPQVVAPCYCCATLRGHSLFTANPAAPWTFRSELASLCGVSVDRLNLVPTRPRINDCAVYGHVCRAVLAVGGANIHADGVSACAVVIDCRPLLQGWHYRETTGSLDFDALEAELSEFAPLFWEVVLTDRPAGPGLHEVTAGQLYTAVYRARREDLFFDGPVPEVASDRSPDEASSSDSGAGSPRSPGSSRGTTSGREQPRSHNESPNQPTGHGDVRNMCGRAGNAQDALCPGACGFTPVTLPPAVRRSFRLLSDDAVCVNELGGRGCRRSAVVVLPSYLRLAAVIVGLCVQPGTAVQLPSYPREPDMLASLQPSGGPSVSVSVCKDGSREAVHSDLAPPRPLPTPCRALPAGPAPLGDVSRPVPAGLPAALGVPATEDLVLQPDFDPLFTLLWESSRHPECQAFFLAATLLEACHEHFQAAKVVVPRWQLSLCSAIPVCAPSGDANWNWNFWEQLGETLQPHPWCPADLPDLLQLRVHEQLALGPYSFPCTRGQIQHFLQPTCSPGDGYDLAFAISQRDLHACRELQFRPSDFVSNDIHCFTDGSFDASAPQPEASCAWACFFISPASGSCAALSGRVPAWAFPEDKPSAFVAECFALIAAAWLSLTRYHHSPTVICSDCLSALGIFQGTYGGASAGVAAVLRSLGLLCRDLSPSGIPARHVRGHQGCLGNELADCLARGAATGRPCGHLAWTLGHGGTTEALLSVGQHLWRLSCQFQPPPPPPVTDDGVLLRKALPFKRKANDAYASLLTLALSCIVTPGGSFYSSGGDMNASLGSVLSDAVGDHAAEVQDDSGALLASFLCSHQLWLPCTFSSCHSGPSGTYVQKRNGALSRIDFVACPTAWQSGCVRTWTDSTLHVGQATVDHIATCCQIDLSMNLSGPARATAHRRFDGRAMLTPQGRAAVEQVFQHAPLIPWSASPHAHAATLVNYLQGALTDAFPLRPGRRHRSYLTDATWALHAEVARLRKACTRVKSALRFHFLAAAFQAWACADGRILLRMLDSAWTREAHVAGAFYSRHLGAVSGQLKSACKQDRATYFSGLADDVQRDDPHANKAIQRLMGLKRRKPFLPDVLPMLQKEDGSLCKTPEEIVLRWREHFRQQEDGFDARPEDLPNLPAHSGSLVGPSLLEDLPSPDVLLQVIAASHKGKAAGPDGLPAEIGHAAPQGLVRLLMPLLLKVGLHCEEPIGFKGGTLSKLYKGKGDTSQCASYRAIMLLPTLAKFLHKAFRPGLYDVFSSNAAPAQLGGLKRTSVVLGSHLTRAFHRFCTGTGVTSVVLFADVASAYYSAVRALTARKHGTERDENVPRLADRAHLEEALSQPSAMTQSQASPWIETLTAELNNNTWMCLAGDSHPIVTRQGSRPGSSFADLFFGVTVPRMLHWRDAARPDVGAHGHHFEHSPVVYWDGLCDLSPPTTDPAQWHASTRLSDVIWADDLAKCIIVPEAKDAAFATASECGLLADAFYAHGYDLSFGPTKTAAIVVPRGAGSRRVRRALFGDKPVLQVMREEQGAALLPLVTSYRHLGVKVTSAMSLMAELRHRAAHAWSAFQQGRTKVFRTGRIALRRRGLLLSTHVMTKLLFAAGAWPALSKGEHAFFFRTVLALYRQTLAIPHGGDQHLTHATICALIGQPPPEVLLLTERARYLLQVVNAAPPQLWALIRRDPPYIAYLREALLWVHNWVRATSKLGDPDTAWPDWEHLLRHRPHIFKAYVKRARGLELARTSCYAALQAVRRSLEQLTGGDPAPANTAPRYPEACLQCKIAFPSRTAWACHASRLHAYRAPSTLLVAGCTKPLCQACGKLYATVGRLKRHLAASAQCRRGWGAFKTALTSLPEAHPEAPPLLAPGDWSPFELELDPAWAHPGLLTVLQGFDSPAQEQVWDAVVEFVEPLEVLRNTLDAWQKAPGPLQDPDAVAALSADVRLLLDPDLWCEDFRAPKHPPAPAVVCPPLPSSGPGRLGFVLSGPVLSTCIGEPPLRDFVYPFRASVPLAAARRQVDWLEAACDVIGTALQQSLSHPVAIRLSVTAQKCLDPLPAWLASGGFRVESDCICSPSD